MEAEIGEIHLQAKEHLGQPEAGESKERPFHIGFGGKIPLPTP